MTSEPIHVVKCVRTSRGPMLDPLFTPTCGKCGPLTVQPVDQFDARNTRKRHEAQARDGRLG